MVSLNTALAAPAARAVYKRLPTPPDQSRNSYDWRIPPPQQLSKHWSQDGMVSREAALVSNSCCAFFNPCSIHTGGNMNYYIQCILTP